MRGARSATEGGTVVSANSATKPASLVGQKIEVDFLYLDLTACSRCRGTEAGLGDAVEAVRPVLDLVGTGLEVRETLVETEEQAHELRLVSSPTILVNGRDIAGEVLESACSECEELCGRDGEVDCRVWNYRGEQHTEAPPGLIAEAILAEIGRTDVTRMEKTPFDGISENLRRFFASAAEEREGISACCAAEELVTCCFQPEKTSCCGGPASYSCGCR